MLTLTRPRRQALVTLALFAFTVLPTVYVGFTAWRINRPGHVRDVEVEIGRSIGLQVTLDSVRYPRPGEVVYVGMVLRQDEPRRGGLTEIARAKSVRLRKIGRDLTLETDGLSLRAASPRQAMAQIGELLGGAGQGEYRQISLAAQSCTVDLGLGASKPFVLELHDVAAAFQNDARVPTLAASYRLLDNGSSTRCEVALARDRKGEGIETTVTLKTMESMPLPARVFDAFFDSDAWLGAKARVLGALTLKQVGQGDWQAEFGGELIDVDLKTLFDKRFPRHRMTGLAHLAIKDARWANRPGQGFGWVSAEGEFSTGAGTIGTELLQALSQEMRFKPSFKLTTKYPELAFSSLGFSFNLGPNGDIQLGGGFRSQFAPDDILVLNDRPLMKAPGGTANVRGLLKTLFPASAEAMAPVTADSQLISRYLPLPPDIANRPGQRLGGN